MNTTEILHPTIALVVPSCRAEQLDQFLAAWEPVKFWTQLVIVEDGPTATFTVDADEHHSWESIEYALGSDSWVISRRDSAIRSFGFLAAYKMGADYIVTLDDDTRPITGVDYLAGHLEALNNTPVWQSSIIGERMRGLPYGDQGVLDDVMLNVGLWRGVPDLDAPTTIIKGCPTDYEPPGGSRVLARGQLSNICGMNMAFRREFTPLAYMGLMGEGWPYSRFDDIWMGIVAKLISDHLGWSITMGTPHIHHSRASDPFVNLVKEAPGIKHNENFWRVVSEVVLMSSSAAGCMVEMGRELSRDLDDYHQKLGEAMQVWATLFLL